MTLTDKMNAVKQKAKKEKQRCKSGSVAGLQRLPLLLSRMSSLGFD